MNMVKNFWRYRDKILSSNSKLIRKILYFKAKIILALFNSDISITPYIKKFETPHGFSGIFISGGSSIGEGCTIFQNVTIGSNKKCDSKKPGSPQIGNNVVIGAGAVIIGGIYIGDNVFIGANATVVEDVPDNCTVVAQKSRIIKNSEKSSTNNNSAFVNAWNK